MSTALYRSQLLEEASALADKIKENIQRHIQRMPSVELAERFDRSPKGEAQAIHSTASHPDGRVVIWTIGEKTAWKHEVITTEVPKESLYKP